MVSVLWATWRSAGVNVGTLNAVAQTALQHDIARVSAAPHAPTLSSLSERLTTSSGGAAPAVASDASSSDRGGNGDSLERVTNRPSAVDRYMALNPQQLYGTNDSTIAGTGSPAGSSAGVGLGTTSQVRATGNGGYTTVAVDNGNTATHPADGSS
jgi:hypothetical protein